LILVHDGSESWLKHSGEDVISKEVDGIFDDDLHELDDLEEEHTQEPVLVIESGLAPVEFSSIDHRLEEASTNALKLTIKLDVEIVELGDDNAVLRKEHEIDMLVGLNFPVFEGGEVNLEHLLVKLVNKVNLGIDHVHGGLLITDVSPLEVVRQQAEEKLKIPVLGLLEVHIISDEVGQEPLHGLFPLLDSTLLDAHSDTSGLVEGIDRGN